MKKEFIVQEIEIHYKRPKLSNMVQIKTSEDAEVLFRSFANEDRIDHKEFFWVLLVSRTNHVVAISEISVGNTAETYVNIKEIFQLALKTNASGVILGHNHPSGNLRPSESDISLTRNIANVGNLLGVTVLDHLILTSEGCVSFVDECMLMAEKKLP